jgi:hypothetical protein
MNVHDADADSPDSESPEYRRSDLVSDSTTVRIRVAGRLDASWSERTGGLDIAVREGVGTGPVTELTGEVADQAALMGVLQQLYTLGLRLLTVEQVGAKGAKPFADDD